LTPDARRLQRRTQHRARRRYQFSDVIVGSQAALETGLPFAKRPRDSFLLALIELPAKPVEALGFGDEKIEHPPGIVMRIQNSLCEVNQPLGDLVPPVAALQHVVIGISIAVDGVRKSDQRGLAQPLRDGLLGDGAAQLL
jgi:hypothetical protein